MSKNNNIFRTKYIYLLIALIPITLTYWQINQSDKTKKAHIASKFISDFQNKETTELITMLDNDLLKFKYKIIGSDSIAYFEFDSIKYLALKNPSILPTKPGKIYMAKEVCYNLLDCMEDIGYNEKSHLLDFEFVKHHFGAYIKLTHENKNIHEFINFKRRDKNDFYKNFDYIYIKLKENE